MCLLAVLPSLFNRRYEIGSREHREEAVAVGGGRLVAGAGGVSLIGRPAAVDRLADNANKQQRVFGRLFDPLTYMYMERK